jgi:hypothetical protein
MRIEAGGLVGFYVECRIDENHVLVDPEILPTQRNDRVVAVPIVEVDDLAEP